MSKDKKNHLGIDPKNTDKIGRDGLGKFTTGNDGKPRGATNKTTRDLRLFITGFLNDKAHEIPTLWDTLEDKDKLSLFMHLCRLVLPKTATEPQTPNEVSLFHGIDLSVTESPQQPIWQIMDNSTRAESLTHAQIDKLIDKL
jgi:hypothetical protein